jgi:hypothetical protein
MNTRRWIDKNKMDVKGNVSVDWIILAEEKV